eukprot:TRINITY_DN59089_c0_g1_i1.p1 TRINITY_DN59089_c0_g1~~TRINITY_DN59089_c0_g1_i1.p1  ORF type:complete len:118 (-),score=13.02 TRINITY_DN59089_c0_g1_i1:100-453(-)
MTSNSVERLYQGLQKPRRRQRAYAFSDPASPGGQILQRLQDAVANKVSTHAYSLPRQPLEDKLYRDCKSPGEAGEHTYSKAQSHLKDKLYRGSESHNHGKEPQHTSLLTLPTLEAKL